MRQVSVFVRAAGFTALTLLAWPVSSSAAAPCPEPARKDIPGIALQEVGSGFRQPTHVADDGSGRLFVVEQEGRVRLLQHGQPSSEPFLDIQKRVDSGGEKGLLAIAFHPRYQENGYFFVNYTTRAGGLHTIVSRFKRASATRADPGSETVLLKFAQPYANHNGGQLAFGPDGYLYIGTGDGGAANDPHNNGQDRSTLLGKILRIDVDRGSGESPYAIPKDNPFVGDKNARAEIWAYGLRNPWRFSFDALNGRLYAADVGQNAAEEIDIIEKGKNYGWRIMEGDICTPAINPRCDRTGLTPPIYTYHHPLGRSITGGFVYRGAGSPALCGVYLYADYISQRLWGLRFDGKRASVRELLRPDFNVSSFGQDRNLELYVADHGGGRILKIMPRNR